MISGLTSKGGHIIVSGGSPSTMYIDNNRPLAGSVKFDGPLNSLMIFDGSIWLQMSRSYASIELSASSERALIWATNAMLKEEEAARLAKDHAAVKIALDNLEKAKQQLDVTIILSKNT